MKRRDFVINTSTALLASSINLKFDNEMIVGHNEKQYKWDKSWALNQDLLPVKDCHEMVFTDKKEIILLTNEVKNNIIYFDKNGKILKSWGNQFPGGHGLTLANDSLFITDTDLHEVYQYSLDGKKIMTLDFPSDTEKYKTKESYIPTETAVAANGDIYVADGYGAQYILHYDSNGKIKNIFGGRGNEEKHLDNAHGICIDNRTSKPTLVITDRNKCCFKIFSLEGELIKKVMLPGANVCRPVIKGDYLYAAVLTSNGESNTGFVVILNKNHEVVSCVGGASPSYENDVCQPLYQTIKLFKHPHDVLVDDEENLYVSQWNSGNVYPYKFSPI
jgi:hypothetical protein